MAWDEIGPTDMGVDIGPRHAREVRARSSGAKTVVWNGPMGVFEIAAFAEGTLAMAQALAEATATARSRSSAAATRWRRSSRSGWPTRSTHVSTGGGASLEFLEGKALPGVACLTTQ